MREIYLSGNSELEDANDIDYVAATNFYKNLHELERHRKDEIVIHLHTIGGDWDDGMSIYDNILYSNCPITIIGHGSVYSIGTIIMQASKKRYLMPNCSFMIHAGTCSVLGDHKTAVSTMDYYKKLEDKMLDIYSSRCMNGPYFNGEGVSSVKSFIKSKIDKIGDWYMTPEEAVEYGFADKVLTKREYNYVRKIIKRNNRPAK